MKKLRRVPADILFFILFVAIWPFLALLRAWNMRRLEHSPFLHGMYSRHLRLSLRFTLYGISGLIGLACLCLLFRLPLSSRLWPLDLIATLGFYSTARPFWKWWMRIPWFNV